MKKIIIFPVLFILPFSLLKAQSINDLIKQSKDNFHQQSEMFKSRFDDFRSRANAEYAKNMKNLWKIMQGDPAIRIPEEKNVPPIFFSKENISPQGDVHVIPEPAPQPQPVPPAQPQTVTVPNYVPASTPKPVISARNVQIEFYGTPVTIRIPINGFPKLLSTKEEDVADMWTSLSDVKYEILLEDCQNVRKNLSLSDWEYICLVKQIASRIFPEQDGSTVLQLYILSQSGLSVIPGRSEDERLYLLVSTDSQIYNYPFWIVDGKRYYLTEKIGSLSLYIFESAFGKSPARMTMTEYAKVKSKPTEPRHFSSKQYPELSVTITSNKNLVDLLGDLPVVFRDGKSSTRWAIIANTPPDNGMKAELYPQLESILNGKSEKTKVEMLLNFVQTAFEYGYDDEIWGGDRAFYPQETLFYPYSDCEDRSILFSRLVRDIVGLDMVLVYYPGHLATAVRFTGDVPGDSFIVNGEKYTLCDPTFIGAPVGATMTGMDNGKAKLLLL